ncbi:MAG: outer-membrane lipoprotein carrier protein LolA [Candidatus Thiodiazotropha sp.]
MKPQSNPHYKAILLILIVLIQSLVAQADESDWSLAYLMNHWQKHGERQVHFTEIRQLALLDQPIEQQGTLLFQPPDRLVRTLAAPSNTKYEIEGNQLTLWRNQQPQVVLLDNIPELLAFSASFRSILSGDLNTLKRYFSPELTGNPEAWSLILKPKERSLSRKIKQIEITGKALQIDRYRVVETNGDQTVTQLTPIDN